MTKSTLSVLRKRSGSGSVTEAKKREILGNREYRIWRRRKLLKYLYRALLSIVLAVGTPIGMSLLEIPEKFIFIVAISITLGYTLLWVRDFLKVLFHRFEYLESGSLVRKKERRRARVRVSQEIQRWDVKMDARTYRRIELGDPVNVFSFGNDRYRAVRSA